MTAYKIENPFEFFSDGAGNALDGGKIYIGTQGLDAETNPIAVYFDAAETTTAAQPIRTTAGYPTNGGGAVDIYTADVYSITVRDANDALVFSQLDASSEAPDIIALRGEIAEFGIVFPTVSALLADTTTLATYQARYGTTGIVNVRAGIYDYTLDLSQTATADVTSDPGGVGFGAVAGMDGLVNVQALGAGLGDTAQDTTAIATAYANHRHIRIPAGDYTIAPTLSKTPTDYGRVVHYLCQALSDSKIVIDHGATLKLADDFSTDLDVKEVCFWFDDVGVSDFIMTGRGTYDFNKDNNGISPDRGSGTYLPRRHALFWSWRVGVDRFLAEGFEVRNANGLNCFVMGQPVDGDTITGSDVRFRKLRFKNCGYDTTDHTSIISYIGDTQVVSSRFENDTIAPAAVNAIELHGSNSFAEENVVDGYHRAFFIGSNLFGAVDNQAFRNNICNVRTQGGVVWVGRGQEDVGTVEVTGNIFNIACEKYTIGSSLTNYSAVTILTDTGDPSGDLEAAIINDNSFTFADTADEPCYAARINSADTAGVYRLIEFKDNRVKGANKAFAADTNSETSRFDRLIMEDNVVLDLTAENGVAGYAFDVNAWASYPPSYVSICHNYVEGKAGQTVKGSRIRSAIGVWKMADNTYVNIADEIQKLSNDQVILKGEELRRNWTTAPTYGTWQQGDIVTLNNQGDGDKGQRYCITAGSPGSWKPMSVIGA